MKKILLSLAALFLFSFAPGVAYAEPASTISALDTVAGFDTLITVRGFFGEQHVTVRKPNGESLDLQGTADQTGKAGIRLPSTQTRTAGTYSASLSNGSAASFTVFPGDTDSAKSGLYADKGFVSANAVSTARVTVRVIDEFNNPLQFHEIKLVSSRSADRISEVSSETDARGIAEFLVSSREAGVSTFTATDESAGETLAERIKIIFPKSDSVFRAVGGDPETVLLAQAGPQVSQFLIDTIPASATVNQTIDFRVSALDGSGNVVSSYTGTVVFDSTDSNVQKPGPYTFVPADTGRKTFSLGLSFRTAGSQKITVYDQSNPLIKGEKTVLVLPSGSSSGGQVIITKPAAGTYSLSSMEIAGEASPSAHVKIFDKGVQITEVTAGTDGRFRYVASLLTDGQHTFHAESNGVQSNSVTISIDSTPANVEQVSITKTNLAPGESTEISIRSDPDLSSVQATVGTSIRDLEADPANPGIYRGTLIAPAQDGEYTINVILTDRLGNESSAVEVGRLRVDASLTPDTGTSFAVPSKVSGVSATPGASRVSLTWQPAQAEAGIALYRIYYGTNLSALNSVANTQDGTTTWAIPNLQNGQKYYFQIVGVDASGNEGDNRSDVVNATPDAALSNGGSNGPVLCDPSPCPEAGPPPVTPQDGPDIFGVITTALVSSSAFRFLRKRKK